MTATTDFHIADFTTLQLFVENSRPPHPSFSLEALNRSRITKLSITLSRSWKFFTEMSKICKKSQEDKDVSTPSSNFGDNPNGNRNIAFWPRLPSILPTHPPGLRKFHLWLDHVNMKHWAVVNERSILAPMETLRTGWFPATNLGIQNFRRVQTRLLRLFNQYF